ncbi:UBN2 domain-containing protein, partial [Cephalotus follicularis]
HEYELFTMIENENISSMYASFNEIINTLKDLGKVYTNHELVSKILRCLPKSWEPKKILMNKKNFSNKPFKKFHTNKGDSSKKEKKEKKIICYECDKLGHIRPECPKLKKKKDIFKKKAIIATWSDSDESNSKEEIEEVANIALMAIEDESDYEVTTSSLSFNELQCEYDELLNVLNDLNKEYSLLKKIAKSRTNENKELKDCILK